MDETRWLNDDEMRLWRAIVQLGPVMQHIEADLKSDADLTMADYEVLVNLSEAPDTRIRMSDLAQRVGNSKSRLSQRIDRMAERGLVEREQCPEDKRSTFAVITEAGMAAIVAAAPGHLDSVRRHLIDKLPPRDIGVAATLLEALQAEQGS